MSEYMDFQYTLKKLTDFCASDESLVYTPYYKFDYPNSHRVQGGLRTKDGQIEAALILVPDSDDKHLVWPVQLEFHLLAYTNKNETTELLGTQMLTWELDDVKSLNDKIQWSKSIFCSLEDLKNKHDSATFVWAVKLLLSDSEAMPSKPAKQQEDMEYTSSTSTGLSEPHLVRKLMSHTHGCESQAENFSSRPRRGKNKTNGSIQERSVSGKRVTPKGAHSTYPY